MNETIVEKIKRSVQSGTGLTCLYGSLDDINVQMGSQTDFPVAFFVLLNTGNLNTETSNYRERVEVAMFFVKPTEFDFESVENEQIIAECKSYAFQWLNSLYLGGELRYITTLNTSRVYNQMDDILTGYAVRVRLEELVGECVKQEVNIPNYLRFTALEDGTIGWITAHHAIYPDIYWSKNGRTWNKFDSPIEVSAGQFVVMRGDNWSNSGYFSTTGKFNLSGNIMSIVDSSLETTELPIDFGCFIEVFSGCGIVDASLLELPATTLKSECYCEMFADCTSLVAAPELPATTLARDCYQYMFAGCTSLLETPELPATELVRGCYHSMFYGCTSLTKAPLLPALHLEQDCYENMFGNCTNLSSVEAWFVDPDPNVYSVSSHWVMGVSPTGTFVKNANATWPDTRSDSTIPVGWDVVKKTIPSNG